MGTKTNMSFKDRAKASLEGSDHFALMAMQRSTGKVECIVNANGVNSGSFLYSFLQDVCDKWGEVMVSEVLTHFLSSRESLCDAFKASLKED